MVKAEMLDGPHYDYEWCEDMAGTVSRGVFQSRNNLEPSVFLKPSMIVPGGPACILSLGRRGGRDFAVPPPECAAPAEILSKSIG